MKKLLYLIAFIYSQIAFAQFPGMDNIIYIECDGDSIAVDITEFQNMPMEFLVEFFDCENIDNWALDSLDVINPWDDENDPNIDNPWGEDETSIDLICNNGEVYQVNLADILIDSFDEFIISLCGEQGLDGNWPGSDWDNDFWDFDTTDVTNPWGDENDPIIDTSWTGDFDCFNSNPDAFEFFMSCENGDQEACFALEAICGQEDNDWEGNDDEWGNDIETIIDQLEVDCASQVDFGMSCGILEMINDCMDGNEESCQELEEYFEDLDEDNDWEGNDDEWGDDIESIIDQLEVDCASQVDFGMSCGILDMINDCMNGNEESCQELEGYFEDLDEDNDWGGYDDDDDEDEDGNCYDDVFPGIGDIVVNGLFGVEEMVDQDMIFIVESSDFIISIVNENGVAYVPEEIDGYLIFGPLSLEEIYTFFIDGLGDFEIDWGMFRPKNGEIISQGTFSTDENSLPEIFNYPLVSIEKLNEELIIYSTTYFDLMGREHVEPSLGSVFIEVKSTNFGLTKEKICFVK
jgi:hypothetical protein